MPEQRHRQHPISQAELARRLGTSRGRVSDHLRGRMSAAALPSGFVDAAHESVVAYAEQRGVTREQLLASVRNAQPAPGQGGPAARKAAPSPVKLSPTAPPSARDVEGPADVRALGGWTLDAICERWGSDENFLLWIKSRKVIADTARIESKNERDAGRLISLAYVNSHVFGELEALRMRLLQSTADRLATRLGTAARAGAAREELVILARDAISTELRMTRASVSKAVKSAPQVGDLPPAVPPTVRRDDTNKVYAFAGALRARLRGLAAPKVVEMLLATIGRAASKASGPTWSPEHFAAVVASLGDAGRAEAVSSVATILGAHVDGAVTESLNRDDEPTRAEV